MLEIAYRWERRQRHPSKKFGGGVHRNVSEDEFFRKFVDEVCSLQNNLEVDRLGKHVFLSVDLRTSAARDELADALRRDRTTRRTEKLNSATCEEDASLAKSVIRRRDLEIPLGEEEHFSPDEKLRRKLELLRNANPRKDWVIEHGGPRRAATALLTKLGLRGGYTDRLPTAVRRLEGNGERKKSRQRRTTSAIDLANYDWLLKGVHVRPADKLLYVVRVLGFSSAAAARLLRQLPAQI
ncbi:MAG: hypothetical protein ACRELY_15905 [Polyangiaceae bacterium]